MKFGDFLTGFWADRNYRPAPGAPDTLRLPLIRLRVQVPKDQVPTFG